MKTILGAVCKAHLVSDFYCGYNDYAGPQQRCWVHLLRDLRELGKEQAENQEVRGWLDAVAELYHEAVGWLKGREPPPAERAEKYDELKQRAHKLGLQHAQSKRHPCQALAKRLLRHEEELFQFVLVPGLAAHNNLAERAIRPLVVIRKVSGGSRSAKGSATKMALASMLHTWQAQGKDPYQECQRMLGKS